MTKGQRSRRRLAGRSPAVAVVVACAVFAPQAAAMSGDGSLSPRLAELAKPSVRALPPDKQAAALSVAPRGPGSLLRRGNRILVDVRFEEGAAAGVEALRAAGTQIVNVSSRYQTVTVAAKPAELRGLMGVAGVTGITEVLSPLLAAGPCPSGAVISEGDSQLRAAEARSGFGVDGSGVTVGILSDSFNQATQAADGSGPIATHATQDTQSGDLPGPGNPCGQTASVMDLEDLEEAEEATDEGRAMTQIVHDLAPGASLAFASAFNGEFAFAEDIERLARPISKGGAGARVIADDVSYLDEPFFQDGPVAAAVDRVAAAGVAYFSAAGNNNLIDAEGRDIASWEAPEFRDAGSCPAGAPPYATHCMDFNPSGGATDTGFGITVEPEETLTVDLQWAQPWEGVATDLDAYLIKEGVRVAENEFPNTDAAFQKPVEPLSWTNPSTESVEVELAINRCDTVCGAARALAHPTKLGGTTGGDSGTPRLKFALLENGGGVSETEYPSSSGGDTVGPTIFGHSGAAGTVSVGAVPFFTKSTPEEYSSRGPVTHYFGPVDGSEPAKPLPSAEALSKPDIAATDCGQTTFFSDFFNFFEEEAPGWHFCGTSAAAPHAAAVAALMLQKDPFAPPQQIRSGLTSTATAVGGFPAEAVGAGLINALGAVGSVPLLKVGEGEVTTAPFQGSPPNPTSTPSGKAVAPNTFFVKTPPKVVSTTGDSVRLAFRFGASESDSSFECKVDRGMFRRCRSRLVRRFAIGRHIVRVVARDGMGNSDPTPAVYRFRVEHVG